jgi:dTDP-L-rhamnose 4-epimerase
VRILLAGGAGFIGTHLARRLAAAGHELTVLDNLSAQVHGPRAEFPPELLAAARCVRGDARRPRDLRPVLEGQELVYWLVAETGTGQSMYRVGRYVGTNLGALAALCDELVAARGAVGRVVLASSRAVYGEGLYCCPQHGNVVPGPREGEDPLHGWWPGCPVCGGRLQPLPTPESAPAHPTSVYGWTKLGQEQLLEVVARAIGVEHSVLRLQNVYGPGQALRNPYTGVLMVFFTRALAGEPLVLFEDGDITRDFVHVTDAAAALDSAGTLPAAAGGTFNIGSGVPTTIRRAAETVAGVTGSRSPIEVGGQYRVGDVRYAVADLSRAAGGLGYRPAVTFAEGIADLLPWVRAQEGGPDRFAASAAEMARRGLLRGWKS